MKYIIVLLLLTDIFFAGGKMIHGNVYGVDPGNNEIELPGVKVWWKDTQLGGFSDENGHFMFDLTPSSNTLIFKMVGYDDDTLVVEDPKVFIFHNLTPITTEEVLVSSNAPTKVYESTINQTETITERSLSKLACCNLSEAFETDPSVDVQYTDPVTGTKKIKLLGLDGKYSGIMIEKIPFVRGMNIPFGMSYLPGPWIESISISKGTADVSNGFENTTGQINVELHQPDEDAEGQVNSFYDAGGRFEFNQYNNYRFSDEFSTMIMLNANIINSLNDMNSDGLYDRPRTRNLNFLNKYKYKSESNGFATQFGVRGTIDDKMTRMPFAGIDSYNLLNQRYEAFGKGGKNFDKYDLAMIWSVSTQNNEIDLLQDGIFDLNQNSAIINLQSNFDISDNIKVSTGASMLYDNFNNSISTITNQFDRSFLTPGVFLSTVYEGIEGLDLSLGIRADYNELNNVFYTPRFHMKWSVLEDLDFRVSAGKGFRYANVLSENIYLFIFNTNDLALSPIINFQQQNMEETWNYGISGNYFFEIFGINPNISAEYYKTDFVNRVVVDQYRYSTDTEFTPRVYETDARSFSESYGIDLNIPFSDNVELSLSARQENAFFTSQITNELVRDPLSSFFKSTNTLIWELPSNFSVRATASYFGQGNRSVFNENGSVRTFDPFWIFSGQINKKIDSWDMEIYLGAQNLGSYTIFEPETDNQAINANFLGTDLWGPIMGRNIYLGINWNGLKLF